MAVDPPTVPLIGTWTEVQLRQIEEFFGGFTNRAGIPDTKAGLRTRANASWPRFMVEWCVCMNEIMAGRKSVPGIPVGGAVLQNLWRPGDDESRVVELADLSFYSVPLPQALWGLNADKASEFGAQVINVDSSDSNRMLWSPSTTRGGVSDPSAGLQTWGLRNTGNLNYWAAAGVTGMDGSGAVTVCGVINLPQWHQSNNGVILLSHRAFDRADETGTSFRLGFELGLGDPEASGGNDLALYYRDRESVGGTSRIVHAEAGIEPSKGRVYLPWNRDHFISIQRYFDSPNWKVRFVLNGLDLGSQSLGTTLPEPGNAPEMRLVFGSDWDGLQHFGGSLRNVMVWPPSLTQPTVAQLQTIYRVGAGFIAKAP